MGLLRIMMPAKFQLLAVLVFAVAMLFIENQIQRLEESRARLGKNKTCRYYYCIIIVFIKKSLNNIPDETVGGKSIWKNCWKTQHIEFIS